MKPAVAVSSNYVRGGGVLMLAERASALVNSDVYGLRDPGNAASVALSRTTGTSDHQEARSGSFATDKRFKTSESSLINVTLESMTADNLALFLGADVERRTTTATPVTNEVLKRAAAGATYPIGRSSSYPEGLRSVTSIEAVTIAGGSWVLNTEYAKGAVVIASGEAHMASVGGTSSGTEPTWASGGGTVVDGTVTWQHLGPEALVVTDDYALDLTKGAVVAITASGGDFATSLSRVPAGCYLDLHLDYTPVAETYVRLKPLDATKTYYVVFYGQAEDGEEFNFCAPYCTAIGDGETQWINAEGAQSFNIQFAALKTDPAQLAIIPTSGNQTEF